jgi:regulator of RNase E activity RraA
VVLQVFARAVGTTAANEVCRVSEVNVPVKLKTSLQDVTISPGDFIVADLNGVVCLPQKLADQVLDAIPPKLATDNKCAEGIRKGRSVQEVFQEFRGI